MVIPACKKETSQLAIEGYVVDATTGKGLGSVTCEFYSHTHGILGSDLNMIGNIRTDENGYYLFPFNPENNGLIQYLIRVTNKDQYYVYPEIYDVMLDPKKFRFGVPFRKDIQLFPIAELTVHLKNVTPADQNDHITLNHYSEIHQIYQIDAGFTGTADHTVQLKTEGNKFTRLKWIVTTNQSSIEFVDSVFCNPGNQNQFTINY